MELPKKKKSQPKPGDRITANFDYWNNNFLASESLQTASACPLPSQLFQFVINQQVSLISFFRLFFPFLLLCMNPDQKTLDKTTS
jgi:hypothetical protein